MFADWSWKDWHDVRLQSQVYGRWWGDVFENLITNYLIL